MFKKIIITIFALLGALALSLTLIIFLRNGNKIESKIVAKIPLTIGSASLSYKTNSLNYGSISRLSESNTTSSSGKNSEYTDAKLELIMEDKKIFTTIQDTDKKVELLESSINSIENYRTQKLMDGGSLYDIVDDKAFIPNIFKKAIIRYHSGEDQKNDELKLETYGMFMINSKNQINYLGTSFIYIDEFKIKNTTKWLVIKRNLSGNGEAGYYITDPYLKNAKEIKINGLKSYFVRIRYLNDGVYKIETTNSTWRNPEITETETSLENYLEK